MSEQEAARGWKGPNLYITFLITFLGFYIIYHFSKMVALFWLLGGFVTVLTQIVRYLNKVGYE